MARCRATITSARSPGGPKRTPQITRPQQCHQNAGEDLGRIQRLAAHALMGVLHGDDSIEQLIH